MKTNVDSPQVVTVRLAQVEWNLWRPLVWAYPHSLEHTSHSLLELLRMKYNTIPSSPAASTTHSLITTTPAGDLWAQVVQPGP
jgi:hypothetical protein